jgi:hypothetical protein
LFAGPAATIGRRLLNTYNCLRALERAARMVSQRERKFAARA